MKLFNIFKSIILEEVSMDVIIDAIRKRKVLIINYQGDEPGGNGLRQIEPVCLGISKAGNRVLRAWDSEGASHTAYLGKQPLPSWRLFRLDKILSANPISGRKYDSLASYKNYYILSKAHFAKWTKRDVPIWFAEGIKINNANL